jgi:hypothetical protein
MSEKYFGDVLQSFQNGVQLDLRVKLAVDMLKSPIMQTIAGNPNHDAASLASFALDLSTALLKVAQERELLKEMPEDNGLSGPLRHHLERNVRAQVYSQVAGAKIQSEEASPLDTRTVSTIARRQ